MPRNLRRHKDSGLAHRLQYARYPNLETMTVSSQHHLRRAGTCFTQGQQRDAVVRPVVVSVWNKKTSPGVQN